MTRCGAIIYNAEENVFLTVLQSCSGYWGFPKGSVENDESKTQCAQREVFEEIGVIIPLAALNKATHFTSDSYCYYLVDSKHLLSAKQQSINICVDGKEIIDHKWSSLKELCDLPDHHISKVTWRIIFQLKMHCFMNGLGIDRKSVCCDTKVNKSSVQNCKADTKVSTESVCHKLSVNNSYITQAERPTFSSQADINNVIMQLLMTLQIGNNKLYFRVVDGAH